MSKEANRRGEKAALYGGIGAVIGMFLGIFLGAFFDGLLGIISIAVLGILGAVVGIAVAYGRRGER